MLWVVHRKDPSKKKAPVTDQNSVEAVLEFREAAKAFTTKLLSVGREEALRVLAEEGIYTRSGRLSKRYR